MQINFCFVSGGNANMKSEFVRQELRAVVSGRTQQPGGIRPTQSPLGGNGGAGVGSGGGSGGGPLGGPGSIGSNSSGNAGIGSGNSGNGAGGGGGPGSGPGMVQGANSQMGMGNQQQLPGTPSMLNTPTDPSLGFNFDMTQTGKFFASIICNNKFAFLFPSPF